MASWATVVSGMAVRFESAEDISGVENSELLVRVARRLTGLAAAAAPVGSE